MLMSSCVVLVEVANACKITEGAAGDIWNDEGADSTCEVEATESRAAAAAVIAAT